MQWSNCLLIFVGEIYGPLFMERLGNIIEPLWKDDDKFKQRAAAEIMIGLIIGEFIRNHAFYLSQPFRKQVLEPGRYRDALELGDGEVAANISKDETRYNVLGCRDYCEQKP